MHDSLMNSLVSFKNINQKYSSEEKQESGYKHSRYLIFQHSIPYLEEV